MLSAMNYEDFRDGTESVRTRLEEEDDLSDDQYSANFGNDRAFHSSNLDETPEIASEVCSLLVFEIASFLSLI